MSGPPGAPGGHEALHLPPPPRDDDVVLHRGLAPVAGAGVVRVGAGGARLGGSGGGAAAPATLPAAGGALAPEASRWD